MQIITSHSTAKDGAVLVTDLLANMGDLEPSLLIVFMTVEQSATSLLKELRQRYPNAVVQGGTSCQGVMTEQGYHSDNGAGAGLLAIIDSNGAYGTAAQAIGEDPRNAAQLATEQALDSANRAGEVPSLIWVSAAPGAEETLIAGIQDVVGQNVPIIGGSTADNDISGQWQQYCGTETYQNAITLCVMFPSSVVTTSFRSGYSPTKHVGRVTSAEQRTIFEIDSRPAADVYREWSGLALANDTGEDRNILADTTLTPLGRAVSSTGGVSNYTLSHPEAITPQGALRFFTDIAEGDEVTLMEGSRESLISRAGRLAASTAKSTEMNIDDIAGALVVYCAGCMMAVTDEMHQVSAGISTSINHAPFFGIFTFGEQGSLREGDNHHGNLMISIILFGK